MSTIFALATPPGKSGVAVVRVSGPGAAQALAALGVAPLPAPRMATLATLQLAEAQVLDRALVLYFPAPHSFTGEDVVEFHLHGSRAVTEALIAALAALPSFRPAEPGEFTRRAFDNGKMDLTMAEGLADLIDAETEAQRRQAVRQMQGEAAAFFEALRADVLAALALLEAYIDFPEEEIPESVLQEINIELQLLEDNIARQLHGGFAAEKIRDGLFVAILGAPNVGKSSLMNRLAGRDVAIVSHLAGTTRDVIEVHLDIAGYAVVLADTAGIREHAGEIEAEGIRRSLARAREADIRVVLVDEASATDAAVLGLVGERTLVVWSKADLGLPSPLPEIGGRVPLALSAKSGNGLDEFMRALAREVAALGAAEASFVTRERHRLHLATALDCIVKTRTLIDAPLELRCEELRRAALEIGKITGKIAVDELLGHIFSRFCIGK